MKKQKLSEDEWSDYVQHSFNVPCALEKRLIRCMKLENIKSFTDLANSAITRRCREIEREHGIDAEGNPLK